MKKFIKPSAILVLLLIFSIITYSQEGISKINYLPSEPTIKKIYENLIIQVNPIKKRELYRDKNNFEHYLYYNDYDVIIYNNDKELFRKLYAGQSGNSTIKKDDFGGIGGGGPTSGKINHNEIIDVLLEKLSEIDLLEIARNTTFEELGLSALKRISSLAYLVDISKNTNVENVRKVAMGMQIILNSKEIGNFKDIRDGKVYKTVKIGNQWIMAENFAYKPKSGNFWAYDKKKSNVAKYGYLYDWEIAKTIAPSGWHLPTKEEWDTIVNFLSDKANYKLFELINESGISGFNALLCGVHGCDGTFWSFDEETLFWSASTIEDKLAWAFEVNSKYYGSAILRGSHKCCGGSVRYFRDN